jgi:serine/threonine-protein phosphatase 5
MEKSLAEKISLDEETKDSETTATESLNTSSVSAESNDTEIYSEEDIKKADEYKGQGNEFFKCKQRLLSLTYMLEGNFEKALDMYSEAIFCKVPKKQKAVYYANRAFVNIKLENYAIALFDANESISCDSSYSKGYYRRGSANVALNHMADAVKDFKKVCQLEP